MSKPFHAMLKISLQYSFSYSVPDGILWSKCHLSLLACPQLFGDSFLPISLSHAKIQLNLASKYFLANFQSFWLRGSFVKQVLAKNIPMSWNLVGIFICSNNGSPQDSSIITSSFWPQHQIFVSGQIFQLWSNYILYYFIIAENLPEPSSIHIFPISIKIPSSIVQLLRASSNSCFWIYFEVVKQLYFILLQKFSN